MPELPEVETVTRQLAKVILEKTIASVEVLKAKSFFGDAAMLKGRSIKHISRRGKMIRIMFGDDLNALIHLKMSGQLIFVDGEKRVGGGHPTADWVNALPSSHTRVIFHFTDKTNLFFNDQRIFGWIKLMTDDEVEREFALMGPDIINPAVNAIYFFDKIHKRSLPIKQLIMDNAIIAGVGNIYACDALNLARISPLRLGKDLTYAETETLLESMWAVIKLGIDMGGATAHGKYVHVNGLSGRYQNVMRVYSRKGEACPNCGAPIVKITVAGRGTFYCTKCQV